LGQSAAGLRLRAKDGRVGEVEWRRLADPETGYLMLGFGHALTIDAAQGITSDEHVNALPRGSAGISAFKAYVAESRSVGTTWTLISEVAIHEAEQRARALGDAAPITPADLWTRVADDMSEKPYKALAIDLAAAAEAARENAAATFMRQSRLFQTWDRQGQQAGSRARERVRAKAVRRSVSQELAALDAASQRNGEMISTASAAVDRHLRGLRLEAASAQQRNDAVAGAREERKPGVSPGRH